MSIESLIVIYVMVFLLGFIVTCCEEVDVNPLLWFLGWVFWPISLTLCLVVAIVTGLKCCLTNNDLTVTTVHAPIPSHTPTPVFLTSLCTELHKAYVENRPLAFRIILGDIDHHINELEKDRIRLGRCRVLKEKDSKALEVVVKDITKGL